VERRSSALAADSSGLGSAAATIAEVACRPRKRQRNRD
jgi:hypothetical protein